MARPSMVPPLPPSFHAPSLSHSAHRRPSAMPRTRCSADRVPDRECGLGAQIAHTLSWPRHCFMSSSGRAACVSAPSVAECRASLTASVRAHSPSLSTRPSAPSRATCVRRLQLPRGRSPVGSLGVSPWRLVCYWREGLNGPLVAARPWGLSGCLPGGLSVTGGRGFMGLSWPLARGVSRGVSLAACLLLEGGVPRPSRGRSLARTVDRDRWIARRLHSLRPSSARRCRSHSVRERESGDVPNSGAAPRSARVPTRVEVCVRMLPAQCRSYSSTSLSAPSCRCRAPLSCASHTRLSHAPLFSCHAAAPHATVRRRTPRDCTSPAASDTAHPSAASAPGGSPCDDGVPRQLPHAHMHISSTRNCRAHTHTLLPHAHSHTAHAARTLHTLLTNADAPPSIARNSFDDSVSSARS
jgi:hypothetical protein